MEETYLPCDFLATSAYNIFKFCFNLSAYKGFADDAMKNISIILFTEILLDNALSFLKYYLNLRGLTSSSSPPKDVMNSILSPVSGEGLRLGDRLGDRIGKDDGAA